MSLWLLLILVGLLKVLLAGLMLWVPYRNDKAVNAAAAAAASAAADEPDASEDDGGSMALPASPLDPHPLSPRPHPRRRGPHGSDPAPPSPSRVRRPAVAVAGHSRTVPARGLPS